MLDQVVHHLLESTVVHLCMHLEIALYERARMHMYVLKVETIPCVLITVGYLGVAETCLNKI